ncbi:kelch-like protein 30 isoform X3 [Malaclemys terrapin pileata]|uniref:kelch-like protein 30 isoform X3 n=1 Tax=Malaclemys terrapin pileata TaxID=2991368 RepID=UPI0023A83E72|nr:kelch-like protein 30 isoform X3 [Malaclemys terrapin pileata]
MVRNVDDFDFSLPSHPQAILEGLWSLRSNPKLSDVTLLVGGHEFPCHRSILALCSHYFNAMFTGDFIESISAHVEIKEVDPAVMETLIDFAYTGKITINQGNVEALIRTSNQLHFPTIQKVCSRYLRQQMDATNCLGICEFGENHGCPEVSSKAWAFLQENFEAVSHQEEFLQLSKERLVVYLSDDLLQVQEEQSLAEAVLRWVRYEEASRAKHLPELLDLVHLVSLPDQYLQNLLSLEPLIQDSEACKAVISSYRSTVENRSFVQKSLLALPQKLEEVLVVVAGRALEENEAEDVELPVSRNFAFYNPKTRTTVDTVEVESYDPYNNSWCSISPALKYVSNFTATGCLGKLYLIGSCAVKYNALTLQCYNPVIDVWSVIASPFIPKYLSAPRCASLHGAIYLIGDNTKKVYVYDPNANIWQKVQLLHTLHENGGMVPLGGKLFVTGGRWKGLDGDYRVEMEVYDCAKDIWTREGALPCLWLYHSSSSIFMDTSKWTEPFLGNHVQ